MITIKDAIQGLDDIAKYRKSVLLPQSQRSLRLGIKALERFNGLRAAGQYVGMPLLKGEKKE